MAISLRINCPPRYGELDLLLLSSQEKGSNTYLMQLLIETRLAGVRAISSWVASLNGKLAARLITGRLSYWTRHSDARRTTRAGRMRSIFGCILPLAPLLYPAQ